MWLPLLSITLLFAAPSPSGRWIAERRLVNDAWTGRIVATDAGTTFDLGPHVFPIGWQGKDDLLRVVRLVDDGHELIEAASGFVHPADGAVVTWKEDESVAGVADAWRRAYAAVAPPPVTASAAPLVVAIDPGHGGPGAGTWNGNNGDGAGARGPNGLTEQWVNLRVAGFLAADLARDPRFAGSFLLRSSATAAVTLADRVALAAQGGAGFYLSIHHNGLPTGAANRTEAYWCGLNAHAGECPDMAWRLHDRIVDAFGYTGRGAFEDSAGTGRFHFYVLRHAAMPAVLTEASNLNDAAEEDRFGHDPVERHAKDEAVALHLGLIDLAFGTTGVTEGAP
ncbi:MAG TPA: N-acetylmuramoyl-L-alanine amidase, partial [Candidatus Eisenbacteria bacterium]